MVGDRRLRAALLTTALVATSWRTAPATPRQDPAAPAQPNVLIVVTDDQRQGLGVMPSTTFALARKGVRFDKAVSTTPLCCPARASIFTGRYAHNHGVVTEADANALDQSSTLQYYLQQAGYSTALFGKYLNSWEVENAPPYFNRWAFFAKSRNAYRDGRWNVNGMVERPSEYSTRFIEEQALGFLEEQAIVAPDQPWFMYLAPTAPHSPFVPERRYRDAYVGGWRKTPAMRESDRSDKPPYVQVQFRRPGIGRHLRRRQFHTLMSVDDLMASVLRSLRTRDELDDTLVFFLSDNGFLWGEHGLIKKSVPYLPSVEVPFLMRVPGSTDAVDDRRLVANIDIAPTVLAATGVEATGPPMDGRPLLDSSQSRDRILLEYYDQKDTRGGSRFEAPTWASTLTPDFQYIEYYKDDATTITYREYYNLRLDPYQLDNVIDDGDPANDIDPLSLQLLSQQLAQDRNCSGTSGLQACP
jgi:arylsulfatase A-like enzyme